jgi:hypothetical protein
MPYFIGSGLSLSLYTLESILTAIRQRVEPILQTQVELYFEEHLLRGWLREPDRLEN